MANYYLDNADLRFYVEKGVDWEPLVRLTEYEYRAEGGFTNVEEAVEFYREVLGLIGDFSAESIAPKAQALNDEHPRKEDGWIHAGPTLEGIFEEMKALELHGMCLPRELGGMNCPFLLFDLTHEIMSRADMAVSTHHGFHGGIAMAMLLYSIMEGSTSFDRERAQITTTRFADEIAEIISGEAWGSMDITEPSAGSDMAALRSRGELGADGVWRVTGQKIFITSGHGKYHFVIARTEAVKGDDAFAGLKGLSMFLVPAWTEDAEGKRERTATFDSFEDKLGHHSSATVAISFDETPCHLIGERGDGFRLMLQLMNNARVGVGFEALGVCEAALRMAREYAAERASMGKTIDRHEMIADYFDEMETDIRGIRALAVASGYHEEMAEKLRLADAFFPPEDAAERSEMAKKQARNRAVARRYTPLLKYLAAEKSVEMARRCLQIHGGYGYSVEYGAERLLRDAVILPIYEGTSQIQALMAMKDSLMGILKNPKGFAEAGARALWRSRTSKSRLERRVSSLQLTSIRTLQYLMSRLAGSKFNDVRRQPVSEWLGAFQDWDPKRDFALAMLHAERLTRILADVAIVEILFKQVRRHPEREELLVAYLERAEPRCRFLYNEITTTGLRVLAQLDDLEEADQPEAAISAPQSESADRRVQK